MSVTVELTDVYQQSSYRSGTVTEHHGHIDTHLDPKPLDLLVTSQLMDFSGSYIRCEPLSKCPGADSPPRAGSLFSLPFPLSSPFSSCLSLLLLLLSPLAGSRGSGPPSSHHWLSTHLCGTTSRAYELTPPIPLDHLILSEVV